MRTLYERLTSYALHILPKRMKARYSHYKHSEEMDFWKKKYLESNGIFSNAHYEHFYTSYFGIDAEEYKGRAILDIGCGPRGSLEWADQAKERIGLDPLVKQYRKLGIGAHR